MADAVGAIRVNVAAMTGQFDTAMKAAAVTATSTGATVAAQATQFKTLDEAMAHTAKVAKELKDVTRAGAGISSSFGTTGDIKRWGKEAQGVFESTRTPMEKYQAEVARLRGIHGRGFLDNDTLTRGMAQAKATYEGTFIRPLVVPPPDARNAVQALQGAFASIRIPGTGLSVGGFQGMTAGAMGATAGVAAAVAAIALAWKGVEAAIGMAHQQWTEIVNDAKQARQLGTSVEAIGELKFAGMKMGLDDEAITGAVIRLQMKIGAAMEDAGENAKFKKMGLDPFALEKMDPVAAFGQVRNAISGLGSDAERMAVAKELFGRSALAMIELFRQTEAGMAAFEARRKELGIGVSSEDAAKVLAASKAWKEFEMARSEAFQGLAVAAAPGIEELAKHLTSAAMAARDLLSTKEVGDAISAGFGAAAEAAKAFAVSLYTIQEALFTIKAATAEAGFNLGAVGKGALGAAAKSLLPAPLQPLIPTSTESPIAAGGANQAAEYYRIAGEARQRAAALSMLGGAGGARPTGGPTSPGGGGASLFGPVDKLAESWNKTAAASELALSLQSRYGQQAQQVATMLMELQAVPRDRSRESLDAAMRGMAAISRVVEASRATAIAEFSRDAGRQLSLPIGIETSAVEEKFKEMIRTLALTAEQQLKLRPTVDALAAREAGEKLLAALPQTSMAREAKVKNMRDLVERYEAGLPKTGSAMRPEDELSKAGRRNIGLAALGYNAESLMSPMEKFAAQVDEVQKRMTTGDERYRLSAADAGKIIVQEQDRLASTSKPLQLPSAAAYGSQEAYNVIAKSQVQSDPKVQLAREANKILTEKLGAIEGVLKEIKDARDQINNVSISP